MTTFQLYIRHDASQPERKYGIELTPDKDRFGLWAAKTLSKRGGFYVALYNVDQAWPVAVYRDGSELHGKALEEALTTPHTGVSGDPNLPRDISLDDQFTAVRTGRAGTRDSKLAVIRRARGDGWTWDQIGAALGMSHEGARKIWKRAEQAAPAKAA